MPAPLPDSDDGRTVIKRAQSQSQLEIGTRLINGTYVVERFLGGGGMGEVYLARHTDHPTQHAIKIIRPDLANDEKILQLFIREARELQRIRSDSIVHYQGFIRDERGFR